MKKLLALGLLLEGICACAQPPWVVDWYQDQILWHSAGRGIHIDPVTGSSLLDLDGDLPWLEPGCATNRIAVGFSATGEPLSTYYNYGCLDVYGIVQLFSGVIMSPLGTTIHATIDISNSPNLSTSVSGVYNYGSGWVEPITLSADPGNSAVGSSGRHALLASENRVFIGGHTWHTVSDDYQCPNVIWKYPYPDASNGTSWRSCVDMDPAALIRTLDLWNDTLLAVAFPKVIKVDTVSGTPMGTFELFSGATANNGHTCVTGDTLYWISQFGGSQLHIGKYLINSGPIWEVTLPFQGSPSELHVDGNNRLWTAVGNNIIWIDPTDGSYQSYAFGLSVEAMDMIGNTVVITGTTDGTTSYVLHATITP